MDFIFKLLITVGLRGITKVAGSLAGINPGPHCLRGVENAPRRWRLARFKLASAFRMFHLWFQSEPNRTENEVQLGDWFDAEDWIRLVTLPKEPLTAVAE